VAVHRRPLKIKTVRHSGEVVRGRSPLSVGIAVKLLSTAMGRSLRKPLPYTGPAYSGLLGRLATDCTTQEVLPRLHASRPRSLSPKRICCVEGHHFPVFIASRRSCAPPPQRPESAIQDQRAAGLGPVTVEGDVLKCPLLDIQRRRTRNSAALIRFRVRKWERETGVFVACTKHRVEFRYRLAWCISGCQC
jgi:hypothetical protein